MPSYGRPTQRDVARIAGVSTATVSYILSGRRDRANPVTEQTRRRVLAAAEELGYQRNHAARSLRRRRTDCVCIVHRAPSNPWVERLTDHVHDAAVRHGYSVITLPLGRDGRAGDAASVLREQYVDGAILTAGGFTADQVTRLARQGLALTVFDDTVPPDGFDVVRQSTAAACRHAVAHLIERGHRRIAYLGHGEPGQPPTEDVRYASYRQTLADHGVPVDGSLAVAAADGRPAAYLATTALLRRPDPPTAVFSASDRAGIAAIWAAHQLGVPVPGGLAVVGVGNTDEGQVISPGLTSVGIAGSDLTDVVDRFFVRLTAPEPLPGTELHHPWRLVVRQST